MAMVKFQGTFFSHKYLMISENGQVLALEHHFEIFEDSYFVWTYENGQTSFKCPDI